MSIYRKCLNDIYYYRDYGELYLGDEDELCRYDYRDNEFFFTNVFIKRSVKKIGSVDLNFECYDAETPYGYGGYCTNISDSEQLKKVLKDYSNFCRDHKIMNEFVRFNPFLDNSSNFKEYFNFNSSFGNVIVLDTTLSNEERWKTYSSGTRNILRKCNDILVVEESDNLDTFLELYGKTMDKNKASEFYYFEKNYFENLMAIDGVKLYEVRHGNDIISMGFFMFSDHFTHYHLSANDSSFSRLNGNYLLLDHIASIGQAHGTMRFLLGGGRSSDSQDGLFKFKKKFSKYELPYIVGGKIYDPETHTKCLKLWDNQNPDKQLNYFQKYRV